MIDFKQQFEQSEPQEPGGDFQNETGGEKNEEIGAKQVERTEEELEKFPRKDDLEEIKTELPKSEEGVGSGDNKFQKQEKDAESNEKVFPNEEKDEFGKKERRKEKEKEDTEKDIEKKEKKKEPRKETEKRFKEGLEMLYIRIEVYKDEAKKFPPDNKLKEYIEEIPPFSEMGDGARKMTFDALKSHKEFKSGDKEAFVKKGMEVLSYLILLKTLKEEAREKAKDLSKETGIKIEFLE